ncbi:Cortactin-binding protein 2, partial [Globisporangium splendens]
MEQDDDSPARESDEVSTAPDATTTMQAASVSGSSKSRRKCQMEMETTPPPSASPSFTNLESACAQVRETATKSNVDDNGADSDDSNEFHDSETDMKHFTIVKKSIYKDAATPSKQESQQSQSYRLPSDAATTASMWDTFYTQEGYAYYVHLVTGVSQWEPPSAAEAAPPLAPSSMQVS